MPTADAQIPTGRASRYIDQLCRHLSQMSRMRHRTPTDHRGQAAPPVRHVDWSETSGTIRFAEGTCTLRATPDVLALRVDTDDEDALRRLQDGIARRLETIGRRDHLTVRWQRSDATPGHRDTTAATAASMGTTAAQRTRRLGRTLVVAGVAALAILIHLGLLGGALAASALARWGTDIVLAIILLTVITLAVHLVLGRTALRRR